MKGGLIESTCVVCGCTDSNACEGGCSWGEVYPERGLGVCSNCMDDVDDGTYAGMWERLQRKRNILEGYLRHIGRAHEVVIVMYTHDDRRLISVLSYSDHSPSQTHMVVDNYEIVVDENIDEAKKEEVCRDIVSFMLTDRVVRDEV